MIKHFIPVVGHFDILARALDSVRCLHRRIILIDNSPDGLPVDLTTGLQVVRPHVPLDHHQSKNLMFKLAARDDIFTWQHSDAVALEDTAVRFEQITNEFAKRGAENWAKVHCNYDRFCVYNMLAVRAVGDYDIFFPNRIYHSDCDWNYRAKLAGFTFINYDLPIDHVNGGSNTIKLPKYKLIQELTFIMNVEYYKAKWGGMPEVYKTPFNQ